MKGVKLVCCSGTFSSLTVNGICFIEVGRCRALGDWNGQTVGQLVSDRGRAEADLAGVHPVEDQVHHPAQKKTTPAKSKHVMDHGYW